MGGTLKVSTESIIELLNDDLNMGAGEVSKDTALFSSGLLDSFSMVTLVVALEKKFGIKVRATDLTLENFDNPVRIAAFLERL